MSEVTDKRLIRGVRDVGSEQRRESNRWKGRYGDPPPPAIVMPSLLVSARKMLRECKNTERKKGDWK